MKSKYVVPGLMLGALLTVGATASAFSGGMMNVDALTNFTSEQKAAITKAFEIRKAAHDEAEAVLAAAHVDRDSLRDAMHAQHEAHREAMDAALEADDYSAFKALVADTPLAEKLTEDVFNKLVEAHTLREAGDFAGARTIMETLDLGMGMEGFGHGGKGRGMHGMN
jgi:hypothetical protein